MSTQPVPGTQPFPAARAEGCPFDPPPELQRLRERTPVTRVRLADGSTPWLVTRHAEQRQVLADPRISSDPANPGYPAGVPISGDAGISFILKDDPEHARLRRMVTAPFAVKRIAKMRPAVQRIVGEHIDALLAGPKPVDLVQALALPVPSLVICELLGVPYTDHDFFQRQSTVLINREAAPAERAGAAGELFRYLDGLIGQKLAHPGEDLLSGLTERIHRGELTRGEAGQMGVLMLVAGHETTANMIALGTLALLEHPDQLALLQQDPDPSLVDSAVEELLRYLHITHNGRRRAVTEDLEIAGQTVRAGEGVILAGDLANRDPSAFPDPDRLDLRRNQRHHVAFGFGVHQCLGQSLARLELQVVYGTLYRRIPTLRLAAPLAEIPFKHDGSVYGVYELPVTW